MLPPLVSGALICFDHSAANAAVVINAVESPSGVIFSYSGALDTTHLNGIASGLYSAQGVVPLSGMFYPGAQEGIAFYSYPGLRFTPYGAGGFAPAASHAYTSFFGMMEVGNSPDGVIMLPSNYQSGAQLDGSLAFVGSSFSSLGVTSGNTYTTSLPNDNTITMNIGAVPVPAPLPLLGLGAATAFSRKLKQRIALKRKQEEVGAAV